MLIFEALDTDLRSSDKIFFIRTMVIFSVVLWCFTLLCIFLWEWVGSSWLVLFWFAVMALCVGYILVSYTLAALFKTNHFLDILLKDTLHELNIPLSVIKANLQMLQADEQESKKLKRLMRIELASQDLYELYKEVDYFIKKEIQTDVREYFFLDELVEKVIEKQKEIANGVEIQSSVLHVKLFADKHGLIKVLSNLLHNALKYNVNKRPISLSLEGSLLCIKDHGIGMSESELFLVFDRYYQADMTKEGHGIGLSLVKAYCDECKIHMRINSQKGVGTEVILDITYLLRKT
ncbi:sensor histidine kinase [Sulfurospirillum barnesii]|uniref:histidine kinase n=1 Tax=Sulfurospirillum barnesii (strain ATCC 700032 / DSM 10660 / SES-3) TaxID=760154 RepID=I3XU44_SULBS|nr:HAMP domain-containing sensor histidine kinase [Sulfurospirillum barnesii]AFL67468.1 histidine kinase [Sulfurospirillum barnesii SES-3]